MSNPILRAAAEMRVSPHGLRMLPATCCALLALAASVPAAAVGSQANAAASSLSLVLTDQDPDDGVTPSMTFLPVTGQLAYVENATQVVTVLGSNAASLPDTRIVLTQHDYYTPISLSVSDSNETQGATIAGSGSPDQMRLSAVSTSFAIGGKGSARASLMGANDTGEALANFILSAHTTVQAGVWVYGGAKVDPLAVGGGFQTAMARAGLSLGPEATGRILPTTFVWSTVTAGCLDAYFGESNCSDADTSFAKQLTLKFSNDSDAPVSGYFGVFTEAVTSYDAPLPTVPEPSVSTLWLLGVAWVASRARARQAKRSSAMHAFP